MVVTWWIVAFLHSGKSKISSPQFILSIHCSAFYSACLLCFCIYTCVSTMIQGIIIIIVVVVVVVAMTVIIITVIVIAVSVIISLIINDHIWAITFGRRRRRHHHRRYHHLVDHQYQLPAVFLASYKISIVHTQLTWKQ